MNACKRLLVAGLILNTAAAFALPVVVGELGDSRGTAFNLDSHFSPNSNTNVFGSLPTATAVSRIDSDDDVDWYSFTGTAGSQAWFDYDDHGTETEAVLALFSSSGTLLALSVISDFTVPGDPGSVDPEPFIGVYTLGYSGAYYLAVTAYANFPNQSGAAGTALTRPDGGFGGIQVAGAAVGDDAFGFGFGEVGDEPGYDLHVSVQNHSVVVPDSSQMVWPLALCFLGCLRWRFGRHQSAV